MKKRIFTLALLATVSASTSVYACEVGKHSKKALEEMTAIDLNKKGDDAVVYNFDSGKCESLQHASTQMLSDAHLPKDSDWQAEYAHYRKQGDDEVKALKHVYKDMLVGEQETGSWDARVRKEEYARKLGF